MGKYKFWMVGGIAILLSLTFIVLVNAVIPGSISGTIYDYQNPLQPLAGVTVCAYRWGTDDLHGCAISDQEGDYTIGDFYTINNSFRLQIIPSTPGTYAISYYPDQFLRKNAQPIRVSASPYPDPDPSIHITGIDFHLVPGGSLSGQVNAADLPVCIEQTDGSFVSCVSIFSDGSYRFTGLISQDYFVRVERPAGITTQYYPDSPGPGGAIPVSVVAPEEISDIDLELPPYSSLTGRVYQAGGPIVIASFPYPGPGSSFGSEGEIQNAKVCAIPFSHEGSERCALTDSQGIYQINYLTEDDYLVRVLPLMYQPLQYFQESSIPEDASPVHVMPTEITSGIDFPVNLVNFDVLGSISGIVYDARNSNQPIAGVKVCSYRASSGEKVGCALSDENGQYWIGNFKGYRSVPVIVVVSPDEIKGYSISYYPDQFLRQNAYQLMIADDLAPQKGIDFHIVAGGSISGQINVPDLPVCLEQIDGSTVSCVNSSSDGSYKYIGLISQDYLIRVERPSGYVTLYYPDSLTRSSATQITLNAPASITGINLSVPIYTSITGYVYKEFYPIPTPIPYPTQPNPPSPLAGTKVCVVPFSHEGSERCAFTNFQGFYSIGYLVANDYLVYAYQTNNHYGRFYPDASVREGALPLRVNPPIQVNEINFTLPAIQASGTTGSITGIVTGSIIDKRVCAKTSENHIVACTIIEMDGSYQINYLPGGSYIVSVRGLENIDLVFYPNVSDFTLASIVEVQQGNITSAVNIDQVPGAQVYDTPIAENLTITPSETLNMTFESVTFPGYTQVIPEVTNPIETPPNFVVNGQQFSIQTTAEFTSAQVCTIYSDEGLSPEEELALRLYHFNIDNQTWEDVTSADFPNTVTNGICGTVTNFSPFVVARQIQTNQPPVVVYINAPTTPVQFGQSINATVEFNDPDVGDTHTVTWTWGDGSTIVESVNSLSVTTSHTYTSPGVYTITATITDIAGTSAIATFQYAVIYDPDGGFVTGGGWITSPTGAFVSDPMIEGKAVFGFTSKYQKGSNIPTGNTEFKFRVANLNFKSTSYDWLVVTGSNYAKYKGSGAINGELAPNGQQCKFMIWAKNGTPDTFRIKIWYEEGGTEIVVYDNGFEQEIGGGSIVVHTQN